MNEIPSMESIYKELKHSGAGAQAEAVIKSIKLINGASGYLDINNRAIALYHLAVALAGTDHAEQTLEHALILINDGE